MKINKTSNAFTLIELLVVIAIIAILASIALPVFSSVQERGKQTKDLSNGKQIALALKQFALDNNGEFPNKKYGTAGGNYQGSTVLGAGDASNDAFRWLLPVYVNSEDIFVIPGSAWCPNGADNKLDVTYGTPVDTLKAGEVGYSYITTLSDTSNPQYPLIADGWDAAVAISYNKDKTVKGGVWGGQRACVIFTDGSGKVMKCDNTVAPANPAVNRPAHAYNIFDNAQAATEEWLSAANFQLKPL